MDYIKARPEAIFLKGIGTLAVSDRWKKKLTEKICCKEICWLDVVILPR